MTKVIFKILEGQVIAFMPALIGDNDYFNTCESYMHIGQHSSADVELCSRLKPASLEQYTPLLNELVSIGYDDIKIAKRVQYADYEARKEAFHANT